MNGFQKRSSQKQQKVLEATFELMNSPTGIDSLTMEQIVQKSGVAKATIFKYFGTKDKLIQAVFIQFMNQLKAEALAVLAEEAPFEATFKKMTQVKIAQMEQVDRQFYLDLMSYYTRRDDPQLAQVMQEYTQQSFETFLELFHRGRKEGKIDLKYSDEFLMIYVEALINGISKPEVYEKALPYTEEWSEVLLKGLAPET